jgi:hypothetical protein
LLASSQYHHKMDSTIDGSPGYTSEALNAIKIKAEKGKQRVSLFSYNG